MSNEKPDNPPKIIVSDKLPDAPAGLAVPQTTEDKLPFPCPDFTDIFHLRLPGRHLLVRRVPAKDRYRGIILPGDQEVTASGQIIKVGELADDCGFRVGDTISYAPSAFQALPELEELHPKPGKELYGIITAPKAGSEMTGDVLACWKTDTEWLMVWRQDVPGKFAFVPAETDFKPRRGESGTDAEERAAKAKED